MVLPKRTKPKLSAAAKVLARLKLTAVRVGVSSVHGVGLIAVRPIKKGEKLFTGKNKEGLDEFGETLIGVPADEITKLAENAETREIAVMVGQYQESYVDDDGLETIPMTKTALDRMQPMWYMNHDNAKSNVKYMEVDGVEALRDIEPGEELLTNFSELEFSYDATMKEFPDNAPWVQAKATVDRLRAEAGEAQQRLSEAETKLMAMSQSLTISSPGAAP